MSSYKSRLAKLEAATVPTQQKYMVVTWDGKPSNGTPEQDAEGYRIQPISSNPRYPLPDGKPFYLATWEDVQAFEQRPDVELIHIAVVHEELTPEEEEELHSY
jgi:hypothetical protein